LEEHPFYVYKPPFLPIHVSSAGNGPRGLPCVAVTEMIQRGGQDQLLSEIGFEIELGKNDTWNWQPIWYRQTSPTFFHEAAGIIEEGYVWHEDSVEAGISVIASAWDEILISRGYLDIDIIL